MHLGGKNPNQMYCMSQSGKQIELQVTKLEKDLGIHIDPELNFSQHCEKQVNKANRILGLIRRTYSYFDAESVTRLYTSLVRPHLEYGNAAWRPMYNKDTTILENVQRRATKLVPGLQEMEYEDRLKKLNLPSLHYRRTRGDMIELYKHTHGMYHIDAKYIKLDQSPTTRGHSFKLVKECVNKRVRQKFLTIRATNAWNQLPAEVVNAPSLNAFKSRLDKAWSRWKFSQQPVNAFFQYDSATLGRSLTANRL